MQKEMYWSAAMGEAADDRFVACQLCTSRRILPLFRSINVWKCSDCGLMFRNPQPRDEELFRLYNESYKPERIATKTTRMAGTTLDLARYYVLCLSKTVEVKSKDVLDFGAGLGTMSRALMEHGANVVAIEPFASAACEQAGIPTFTSLAEVPRQTKFDIVVAIDVIEHLRRPWETLSQISNLLKPKGWLCVKTLNTSGLNARLTKDRWREMMKPDHLIFFTPATLKLIFNKAGFDNCVRLKWFTRHSHGLRRGAHILIEAVNLDGELRYLAQRN